MGRILYECLDLQVPSGGIKRIYRHVEILRKHGFEASILHHRPGFQPHWFTSSAPIEYWTPTFRFDESDVLVIPEGHANVMKASRELKCRRVAIVLNWSRVFLPLNPGETWQQFGIDEVIAGSEYEGEFIRRSMGIVPTVIVSGIDTYVFAPACSKKPSIVYMPRKDVLAAHLIHCIFRARYPEFNGIPFVPIEGMSHSQVARTLSEATIFLAQTTNEGLSRKMLEAMACGCIVVGFSGRGSLECMKPDQNCYLAPDGDVLVAAELLAKAAKSPLAFAGSQLQRKAISTAKLYSLEREELAVAKYWQRFMHSNTLQ